MNNLKVGDCGKIKMPYQGMGLVGAKAKVVSLEELPLLLGLDIQGWSYGHTCDVLPKGTRSGYWVPLDCFEKVSTFKGNK